MLPLSSTATGSLTASPKQVTDTYLDQNSLNSVKAMGRKNDPAALKEIAKKFEAMFVQQMMKSMREANEVFGEDNPFSSSEVKFHQEMLDQQMVLNLTSGEGIGLAKTMYQQMQSLYGKKMQGADSADAMGSLGVLSEKIPAPVRKALQNLTQPLNQPEEKPVEKPTLFSPSGIKDAVAKTADEFIAKLKPYAEKAAAELNVGIDVLLAQAALETGWGKHLIHDSNGNNSFNLFNIKATGNWQGKSVAVNSLENRGGIARQERSEFRQYESYLHSFADYVKLIKNNPRYEKALEAGADSNAYATELQKAGYATDPEYAQKIQRLLNSDSIRSAVQGSDQFAAQTPETGGPAIVAADTGVQS
jgi:peptidoglycan hydrolase FlgJ